MRTIYIYIYIYIYIFYKSIRGEERRGEEKAMYHMYLICPLCTRYGKEEKGKKVICNVCNVYDTYREGGSDVVDLGVTRYICDLPYLT